MEGTEMQGNGIVRSEEVGAAFSLFRAREDLSGDVEMSAARFGWAAGFRDGVKATGVLTPEAENDLDRFEQAALHDVPLMQRRMQRRLGIYDIPTARNMVKGKVGLGYTREEMMAWGVGVLDAFGDAFPEEVKRFFIEEMKPFR